MNTPNSMSNPILDERLLRLMNSGICGAEDPVKCAANLKELANRVASVETSDKQSRFFKALADEIRLRILKLLNVREMCVCEVMVALDLTQPTASHHLGILENAGIIKDRKEGKWVFYSIANPKLMKNIQDVGLL